MRCLNTSFWNKNLLSIPLLLLSSHSSYKQQKSNHWNDDIKTKERKQELYKLNYQEWEDLLYAEKKNVEVVIVGANCVIGALL